MARRRRRVGSRTKLVLAGVAGLVVGYFLWNRPAVFASTTPICPPCPATCVGIGGLTGDLIVGDTVRPVVNPLEIAVF